MGDKSNLIDTRTIFAAVALHKLLSGMEDPEQWFSQMGDGYSELCTEAWNIADRMLEADRLSSDKKCEDSTSGELTNVA